MSLCQEGLVRPLRLDEIGDHFRRYRLHDAEAEQAMIRSMQRYGQISPIVVCVRDEVPHLIDGFKRVGAARSTPALQMVSLSARFVELSDHEAKAAMYGLNRVARRTTELEEAWIIQALVREHGLSQIEVAELLGRHKSWVCRRLAMLEKLCYEAIEDLRVGVLSPTAARQLTRLPAGNQVSVLSTMHRDSLNANELTGVVDLMLAAGNREKESFVLAKPREALHQYRAAAQSAWDPRLSSVGNRMARKVGMLLDLLGQMDNWLRHRGWADLSLFDRGLLEPGFARLSRDAREVAELAEEFARERQRDE